MRFTLIILFLIGFCFYGEAQMFGGFIKPTRRSISSLSCTGAIRFGNITPGASVGAGVTLIVPYTGGNGAAYTTQTIPSTGVTGLSLNLPAGNFKIGDSSLTFTITGNASGYGTAFFPITVGGQSCTLKTDLVPNLPLGSGALSGRICFDIALSNDNANGCGTLVSRTSIQANFTQAATHTQTYTFTPTATVSNVRFAYINTNGNVIVSLTGGNSGNNIASGTAINATVNYSQTLNADALGLTNANSLTADIFVVYNDGATNNGTDRMVKLTAFVNDCGCCMAKITPTTYANFLCHNLGANTSLDPHTPVLGLHGSYIQWGKRGPNTTGDSRVDWQTATNDGANGFASNPIINTNQTIISGWSSTTQADNSWRDNGQKTANDPCPSGFRVPTIAEWAGVVSNNTHSTTGTFTNGGALGNSAFHFGPSASIKTLTLPAAGAIEISNFIIGYRNAYAYYWSSNAAPTEGNVLWLSYIPLIKETNTGRNKRFGLPVRCIQEYTAVINSLSCVPSPPVGTLMANSATPAGVTSTFSYTASPNNTGSVSGSFPSTGVTGLTATITSGFDLTTTAGTIVFTITGTPSSAGTATFNFTIGGKSCSFTRTVLPYTIPASITLAQNQKRFVASVYDQNYLPYTAPTTAAALTTPVNADATNEAVTVNYQGFIDATTGISATIPVTCNATGTLPAFQSAIVNVPAQYTEDGISRDVQLSWNALSYTTATRSLPVTIKAIGGTLNLKKLDINAGIGNDYLGIIFASFTHPYNSAGATTSYTLHDIPGIPDKQFGVADNSGSSTVHNFLYLPVVAINGSVWLNNNLGANYSNLNSADFNPTQQAINATDHKAYGSLFQWGRKPDGHELINWASSTVGTRVNGPISTTNSDNPNHPNVIFPSIGLTADWRQNSDATLWATEASANNPCPYGFRLPTRTEFTNFTSSENVTGNTTGVTSTLRFPYSNISTSTVGGGNNAYLHTNEAVVPSAALSYHLGLISGGSVIVNTINRVTTTAVRCIKN